MPDPMIALRALRQIRGGADSPVRRLAELAASRRMSAGPAPIPESEADDESIPRPEMEIEIAPDDGGISVEMGGEENDPVAAVNRLGEIFAQLDTGYGGREALRGGDVPTPSYQAAGMAPRVGGMEEDEDDDLDRTLAALMRGR